MMAASLLQLSPQIKENRWLHPEARALSTFWPQGWTFFDSEPDADAYTAFSVTGENRVQPLNQLEMSANNAWGLSRGQLTQFVEINSAVEEVPVSAWLNCSALAPDACTSAGLALPIERLTDTARQPSLCGHYLLGIESPKRWTADTRQWMEHWKILKIANVEITCGA